MKRRQKLQVRIADALLLALALVSGTVMFVSEAVADPYPSPGDCTNFCQMRSDFHGASPNAYIHFSISDCFYCTGSGRCQFDTLLDPYCRAHTGFNTDYYSCTSGTDICPLGLGANIVEAETSNCTFVQTQRQFWCTIDNTNGN